jgi:hypothetical protein
LDLIDAQRPRVGSHELGWIVECGPQVQVVVETTYIAAANRDELMEKRCLASLARSVQHEYAQAVEVLGRVPVDLATDLVLGCGRLTTVALCGFLYLQIPDGSLSKTLNRLLANSRASPIIHLASIGGARSLS